MLIPFQLVSIYLAKYRETKNDVLDAIRNKNWDAVRKDDKSTLVISKQFYKHSSVVMWRGDITINNLTTKEFMEKAWSDTGVCSTNPHCIDPNLEYCKILPVFKHHESIHNGELVLLQSKYNSGVPLISDRELLVYRNFEKISDNEYIVCGASVNDDDFPDIKPPVNCVRANVIRFGYLFKEEHNDLHVTFVSQTSVNGCVPDWIANKVNISSVESLLRYKQYFSNNNNKP
jgi:hypothetical protein